jgi:leader peptidase (prepilin peptidase)/N-methyltransferase
MPDWFIYMLPWLTILLFVIAVGACVGSLINVLVYRMPRGLDVVVPTSRCPSCDHKLSWRENIPIFGWLLLRGKCRFCKAKISPEYPIVETIVAALFGGIWALWYIVPDDAILGLGQVAPEWAANGAAMTWPATVVLLVLVGCLVAMTIIDARTSTIPLELTWVPALAALILHTGHAAWFYQKYGGNPVYQMGLDGIWVVPNAGGMRWLSAPNEVWTIATGGLAGWKFIGIGIGGIVGLGISNLMLKLGWLTRSFSDFDEWYEAHHKNPPADENAEQAGRESVESADAPIPTDAAAGDTDGADSTSGESGMEDWLMYPHARREMIKELAFLCPPVLLGLLGSWGMRQFVEMKYGPWTTDPATGQEYAGVNAPLWLVVLGGVLMGYLIAGGVVWAVRIGGSLAFGKEAMGLGDVHMMAAVGACLGWIDPTIAFFLAAFVGVGYAAVAVIFKNKLTKAMPYGPFLAIATLMVVLGKPLVEIGLGRIFGMDAPLNLP